jgi:hypothetical protein
MAKKKATGICLSEVRDSLVASSAEITADFKAAGRCYNMKQFDITAARSKTFDEPIFVDEWIEPAGAKGELDGPC